MEPIQLPIRETWRRVRTDAASCGSCRGEQQCVTAACQVQTACTPHDRLMSAGLMPREEGRVQHTHARTGKCSDVYIIHYSHGKAECTLPQGSIQRQAREIKKIQVLGRHQLAEVVTAETGGKVKYGSEYMKQRTTYCYMHWFKGGNVLLDAVLHCDSCVQTIYILYLTSI